MTVRQDWHHQVRNAIIIRCQHPLNVADTFLQPGQFGTQHSADRGSRQKALSVMSTAHTATGPDSETDTATETATHLEISAKTSEAASFTTTTSSDFSLQSIAKGHLLGMSPTNSAMAKSLFSSVYCDPKSETSLNSTPQRSVFQSTKAPTSKGLNDVTNRWKSTPLSMSAPLESFLVKETPDSGDKTLKSLGFPAATSSTRLRRTPPLCSCGKRSKRKAVQTPGPNVGRFFFCCPSGKDRCGFFKWEISIETPRSLSRGYCTPRTVALSKSTESFILPPLPQPNFDTPGSHVGTALRTKTLGVQRYAVPKPVVSLQWLVSWFGEHASVLNKIHEKWQEFLQTGRSRTIERKNNITVQFKCSFQLKCSSLHYPVCSALFVWLISKQNFSCCPETSTLWWYTLPKTFNVLPTPKMI